MKVTMLGCGGSAGVPVVGAGWGDCDPAEPRNRRRRASVAIESGGRILLIDLSPDLRVQLLDAGIDRIDAVLLTHPHADHLHGIDDLRPINRLMNKAIPLYADAATLAELRRRFGYALSEDSSAEPEGFYRPSLVPHEIGGPFTAAGFPVVPFAQDHGFSTTLGFRIGAFGYSTDVTELDDNAFKILAGIEFWIVDCLRRQPHTTHSHLAQTLEWIARLRPRRAAFTHMDQGLDYRVLAAELPPGVEPGYDGLTVELPDP
jgi:phosphoribosyl 1,2-cyclic phosphate phosphodiesterase